VEDSLCDYLKTKITLTDEYLVKKYCKWGYENTDGIERQKSSYIERKVICWELDSYSQFTLDEKASLAAMTSFSIICLNMLGRKCIVNQI